jgi:rubrerythrin
MGKVVPAKLDTVVPPREVITAGVSKLTKKAASAGRDSDLQVLQKALEVEHETSAFYRKMVAELPGEGKALYRRFVEIEEGHGLIVQAEIDALTQTGFWFEFRSTDLED